LPLAQLPLLAKNKNCRSACSASPLFNCASIRRRNERCLASVRAALDPAACDAAWEAGRKLTLEQAIALAQDETPRVG
jgi:hypothetical protein